MIPFHIACHPPPTRQTYGADSTSNRTVCLEMICYQSTLTSSILVVTKWAVFHQVSRPSHCNFTDFNPLALSDSFRDVGFAWIESCTVCCDAVALETRVVFWQAGLSHPVVFWPSPGERVCARKPTQSRRNLLRKQAFFPPVWV